ncbi:flagellar basal body P-ring formation protein FlgA [Rhodospirillaceae bacterium KN72]|uniref:Flagellar basal body P-ring formation protein FlgA n=1 Tax=Pacificispira spongiicola TaxID=2729598 RepID=A0A7Y0HIA2_9PROT|nr:flagellar basal body P-ring formation chaperone FlgA [Pacificispira spongiicola]NMM46314.1 flagellar basal body P-ring formation protein FlgA [Pacificispira spongiicola]
MNIKTTHGIGLVYALLLAGMAVAVGISAFNGTAHAAEDDTAQQVEDVGGPVVINPIVQVDGDYVLLADLFSPAEKYGDRVVLRSPEPGQETVLPAVWLWKVAKTFGIDWQPSSTADTITVNRRSTMLKADSITGLLRDAYFKRTGEDDLVELETDGTVQPIHLPVSTAPTVRLDRFDLDNRTGRFTATVIAPAEGRPLYKTTVAGRFLRVVEMPVPTRRLGKGHVIEPGDIAMVRLHEEDLGTNLIVDPDRLIGQAVWRSLSTGRPVANTDVRAPVLIEKGRVVSVMLQNGSMTLTVQGRAMQDGSKDEVIRVQNTQSNMVIEAVVVNEGRVMVTLPENLALNTQ